MTSYRAANEQMGMAYRDVWTTAYVNDLPDSSFLYIAPGGTKTAGKTDGAHRYFPVKDASGKVDLPHLKNALARIPQASSIPAAARMEAMTKAKGMAKGTSIGGPPGTYEGSAGSGRANDDESIFDQMPMAPLLKKKNAGAAMAQMMGINSTPPPTVEVRSFEAVLELRADGEGRTLVGRAVPYGEVADIPEGRERFLYGAFARQLAAGPDILQRVKLFDSHQARGGQPVGRTAALSERSDGLYGDWPLYATSKGNDALELIRTGEVTGLSIGFKALSTRRAQDGTLERTAAHLDHVALTHEPVYNGAAVMTVRSQARPLSSYRTEQQRHHVLIERLRITIPLTR